MNPAALGKLRAIMASLKKAGRVGARAVKRTGRMDAMIGKSGRMHNMKATVAAAVGSVKRHVGGASQPLSKAEQVMAKLDKSRARVRRVGKRIATDVGIGAGLVGGVAGLKAMQNKKKKKQLMRRAQ